MYLATVANDTGMEMELHGLRDRLIEDKVSTPSGVGGSDTAVEVAELFTGAGLSQFRVSFIAAKLEQEAWVHENLNLDPDPESPLLPGLRDPKQLLMELDDIASSKYVPSMGGLPATETARQVPPPQPVKSLAAATDPNQDDTLGAELGTTNTRREKIDEWRRALAATAPKD